MKTTPLLGGSAWHFTGSGMFSWSCVATRYFISSKSFPRAKNPPSLVGSPHVTGGSVLISLFQTRFPELSKHEISSPQFPIQSISADHVFYYAFLSQSPKSRTITKIRGFVCQQAATLRNGFLLPSGRSFAGQRAGTRSSNNAYVLVERVRGSNRATD